MKLIVFVNGLLILLLMSCGNEKKQEETPVNATTVELRGLENKGIGPIQSLELPAEIDTEMAKRGEEIFNAKCSACHKTTKKFIGPNPTGIMEQRSPEWIMNMILNPEEMVQKDPDAKDLLMEYNGSPMANQNLTEEEARSILEYYRTLK